MAIPTNSRPSHEVQSPALVRPLTLAIDLETTARDRNVPPSRCIHSWCYCGRTRTMCRPTPLQCRAPDSARCRIAHATRPLSSRASLHTAVPPECARLLGGFVSGATQTATRRAPSAVARTRPGLAVCTTRFYAVAQSLTCGFFRGRTHCI